MKLLLLFFFSFSTCFCFSQQPGVYVQELATFRAEYVAQHEVVKGANKSNFDFFPADRAFAVNAKFTELKIKPEVTFQTSAGRDQQYLLFGQLYFRVNDKPYELSVYYSPEASKMEKYKDYLFVPFTDLTNGAESYGGGRYIDLFTTEIKSGEVLLDFNKCYNPYCAYAAGFMCPVPLKENALDLSVTAGEKTFKKAR